jgi:hypothetical protein
VHACRILFQTSAMEIESKKGLRTTDVGSGRLILVLQKSRPAG